MAKRKRKSKKSSKKDRQKLELKQGAKTQFLAIFYFILAIVIAIGWFVDSSAAGVANDGIRWLMGGAIYVLPFILLILARDLFKKDEEEKLPLTIKFGSFLTVVVVAGLFHAAVDRDVSWERAGAGEGGGVFGHLIDSLVLGLFGAGVGILVLVALLIISISILFNVTPKDVLSKLKLGRKKKSKAAESETNNLDAKRPFSKPTLNSNVPLVDSAKAGKQRSSFKNAAAKLSKEEDHEALTARVEEDWNFPEVTLLDNKVEKADAGDWKGNAEIIQQTLADFKIEVGMGDINVGPRVTQYTLSPPSGVKLNKITALEQNIALNLAAQSIRIEAPIPGKRAVGVEVPNKKSATVRLRGILESNAWRNSKSNLTFALGKDISGESVVAALDSMPHVLIAGQTGSGKSVMINTLLTSLLYRNSPEDMQLILVDPKQVELNLYANIPHLLTPVIVEPEKCISALKWAVAEMERRYSELAEAGKRNIADYNKVSEDKMPYIVIVIDELADLMMMAARDVESLIVRIAQKARATGIHLVLATQRPSVDVITGLIKANIPARIAFTVASQVDSRTILDMAGAEKLLGKGDMLYTTPALGKPRRVQGVFVDDPEVNKVVEFVKGEREPNYNDEVVAQPVQLNGKGGVVMDAGGLGGDDDMFMDAARVVIEAGKGSTSLLQRRLRVGYSRAANLMDMLEERGIVGQQDGQRAREVLVSSIDDIVDSDSNAEI
ncbi:TPA: hypothetical protein EYO12_04325 [Candidatus Saccharibacteria bacterium]|nr:hypothetical protein [Candidatus Saccharibacteria bacterium]HIO87739.1 hypothetical protein [Candidatus Saccharibacteria bacterium]